MIEEPYAEPVQRAGKHPRRLSVRGAGRGVAARMIVRHHHCFGI